MLDLILVILLFMGFFVGLRRGFILQLIHLTGFIIAYIVAKMYYNQLAPKLTLWIPYPNFGNNSSLKFFTDSPQTEEAFYRAIAFVIIFFAAKIVLQIIASMLDFIARLPILRLLNVWAGGILGFFEVYLLLFLLLFIAALVPVAALQGLMNQSVLANLIVNHTPILSEQIKRLVLEYSSTTTSL